MNEPNSGHTNKPKETIKDYKSVRVAKYLSIVSMFSVLLGAICFLLAFSFKSMFTLSLLPVIFLFSMAPVLSIGVPWKRETQDKYVKKTSRLAITSLISIILAISSIFLIFLFGPICVYAFIIFIVAAFILGEIALAVIAFRPKRLKGRGYAIIALVLAIFCTLLCAHRLAHIIYYENYTGKANLQKLAQSINEYTEEHENYLPNANQWCDLLMEIDKRLTRDKFKHPLIKNSECDFAFNKNLDSLRLADIPGDVILLFGSEGDWNLNGGSELLKERTNLETYVLFVNGDIYTYDFSKGGIRKYNSVSKKASIETLRWKP